MIFVFEQKVCKKQTADVDHSHRGRSQKRWCKHSTKKNRSAGSAGVFEDVTKRSPRCDIMSENAKPGGD